MATVGGKGRNSEPATPLLAALHVARHAAYHVLAEREYTAPLRVNRGFNFSRQAGILILA
jgi:hypothetical protein